MKQNKTILIINQTAGSPYHGMVYRNYYLAREWVKKGQKVIIISGSYFHNFSTLPKTDGLFTKDEIDGIEYWWVKLPKYSKSKSLGRLFTLFLFPLLLLLFPFWRLKRPETVIVSGPPHVSIFNAWFWSKIWNASLIYEVRDIWPLTIIKLGNISPWNPLILFLGVCERFAYRFSDKVVSVLALANRHFEKKGMAPDKFAYIPNGVDIGNLPILESSVSRNIEKLRLKNKIVIYTGSFGIANNLDQMLDAAAALQSENYHFVFVGDGPHREALMLKAKDLSKVSFFGPVPKSEIPAILNQADIAYVGLRKTDLFKHGISPNKLFDYMAASKPVIMAIDTEDDIVGKAECGISVPSCSPEDIASAVRILGNKETSELKQIGKNGRTYLEKNHTYKSLAEKYIRLMEKSVSDKLVVSPFWFGFNLVLIMGLILHYIVPLFIPQLFKNGITTLLIDPHIFNDLAAVVANSPWRDFTLRPQGQFPAGVLAFLYKITSYHKPAVLVPILAMLAGLTMKVICSCLNLLGVRGRWWPLLLATLFTVTPTSISWMIYPHKDAFIVPGVILICWSFLSVTLERVSAKQYIGLLLGSLFVFLNKPYFAELLIASTILCVPLFWISGNQSNRLKRAAFSFTGLLLFTTVAFVFKGYIEDADSVPNSEQPKVESIAVVNNSLPRHLDTKENWIDTWGGKLVNKPLLALAYTRERFLHQRSYGNTNFLQDIHLKSGNDTLLYLPHAIQLAFFEPLPWRGSEGSIPKQIIFRLLQVEMIVFYFLMFSLILAGRKSWKPSVLICIALALPFLLAFGFAVPNIGSVNRYRFPFLLIMKVAGFAALWNSSRFRWPGKILMWADPPELKRPKKKVLFLVPDDATFVIQRLVMAQGIQRAGYDVHVACPDLGYGQKIRELGFTFHLLDLNRGGLNPFADFIPFIRLVLFLAKERPDILQCVSIKPVIYGATAGTMVGLKRISCLVNGLGYAFEGRGTKGKIVLFVAKALYRNALAMPGVRVIFQNPDDQQYFIDSGIVDANKTLLIRGSGVNMQKFAPTPPPRNENPVILFVGRLLWSKGIRELVEAATKLKGEGLKFTLKIVGVPDDRNPEAVPSTFLKENHDKGIIEWLGRQTDMPKFYRESDVVTLPTAYREGLPLTLLEAASTGRPLISTDMPGCREIVRDGENGFLVPPQNSEELANALRKLIVDSELRKKFGESSAEIVRQEFSSEIVQQKLLSVYESLYSDSLHSSRISVTTA